MKAEPKPDPKKQQNLDDIDRILKKQREAAAPKPAAKPAPKPEPKPVAKPASGGGEDAIDRILQQREKAAADKAAKERRQATEAQTARGWRLAQAKRRQLSGEARSR